MCLPQALHTRAAATDLPSALPNTLCRITWLQHTGTQTVDSSLAPLFPTDMAASPGNPENHLGPEEQDVRPPLPASQFQEQVCLGLIFQGQGRSPGAKVRKAKCGMCSAAEEREP